MDDDVVELPRALEIQDVAALQLDVVQSQGAAGGLRGLDLRARVIDAAEMRVWILAGCREEIGTAGTAEDQHSRG